MPCRYGWSRNAKAWLVVCCVGAATSSLTRYRCPSAASIDIDDAERPGRIIRPGPSIPFVLLAD